MKHLSVQSHLSLISSFRVENIVRIFPFLIVDVVCKGPDLNIKRKSAGTFKFYN